MENIIRHKRLVHDRVGSFLFTSLLSRFVYHWLVLFVYRDGIVSREKMSRHRRCRTNVQYSGADPCYLPNLPTCILFVAFLPAGTLSWGIRKAAWRSFEINTLAGDKPTSREDEKHKLRHVNVEVHEFDRSRWLLVVCIAYIFVFQVQ